MDHLTLTHSARQTPALTAVNHPIATSRLPNRIWNRPPRARELSAIMQSKTPAADLHCREMTPTARTILPTDLVALVSYDGRVYANQAITLDRIGTQDSPHPIETAFEQWFSFATGRHTWISVKGATLRGLISARKRGSKQAWEIDCLINAEEDDPAVLMSLLDQVTDAAGKSGAMKIFLRLPVGSVAVQDASRCGFAAYRREQVWRCVRAPSPVKKTDTGLRRRAKPDQHPIFQLYNAHVPEQLRRYEGITMTEWTATQESLGKTAQYVIERDGRIDGLLRLAGDGDVGRFDVLGGGAVLGDLIDLAVAKLANRATLNAIVPTFQEDLARRLADRAFGPAEEFVVMARRTVRPVTEARKVPAVGLTTFG
jgi:hypothetical protein